MKIKSIIGIVLIILGIIFTIYTLVTSPEGQHGIGNSLAIFFACVPLFIMGFLALFSSLGSNISFVGGIILLCTFLIQAFFRETTPPSLIIGAVSISYLLFIIGIIYGIGELIKKYKK